MQESAAPTTIMESAASAEPAASAESAAAESAASAKVYLIGAGPGDPELITLKGRRILEEADVIIYDYLSNSELLKFARDDAERIFVGKKGFSAHVTQEEICNLLVQKATTAGVEKIARLKGGDPFVFGRGGEEALVLEAAGIPFEIVPGVTAGIAAPAYAGIPVTHRGMATSVAFITGNEDPTKPETQVDWSHIAHGADTLCFYMGIKNLRTICKQLVMHGRPATTPVALVRWGSLPRQQTLVGTLKDIADKAEEARFEAPAIIVVGDVVSLREDLKWFEDRPLFGRRIAVTRSRTQASALVERLAAMGADVTEFPTIEIGPLDSYEELDATIERLGSSPASAHPSGYTWAVFTSVNGVEIFFDKLLAAGKDARAFAGMKVAAIGPATASALCDCGIVPDIMPSEYRAESVINALLDAGVTEDDSVLIARAEVARDVLPDSLREHGVAVDVVPVYRTVSPDVSTLQDGIKAFMDHDIEAITFTSSSTVKNFAAIMGDKLQDVLVGLDVFSIGPVTSKTAAELDIAVTAQAEVYTIEGLIATIEDYYGNGPERIKG